MPQIKPTRGLQLNRSHPLSRGLLALGLFNEGCGLVVNDFSGSRRNGILVSDVTWVAGKHGSALLLGGSADYIDYGNILAFESNEPFTISILIKRTDTTGNTYALSKMLASGAYQGYAFFTVDGNVPAFIIRSVTGTAVRILVTADAADLSDGQWHLYTITYTGSRAASGVKMYEDGVNLALTPASDALDGATIKTATSLNIGARADGGNSFACTVDSVKFWNRVLPIYEIQWDSREPFCMFRSVGVHLLEPAEVPDEACSSTCVIHGWLEDA